MPDDTLRLRLATPEDADRCALVHRTAWVEAYADLLPLEHWDTDTLARRRAQWHRRLESGTSITVAERGGRIVGFASAAASRVIGGHAPTRDVELTSIYVLAAHHGTGIGQTLLDHVLVPGTPAQLWVLERNPRARRFYERNGFAADGTRFVDPDLSLAELRYVR